MGYFMDTRNWTLRYRQGATVALLAMLAACGGGGGGGGGGGEPPALTGNFFPLAVGDRWVYDGGATAPVLTVRATATRTVDGQTGIVVATDDPMDGTSESVYVVGTTAVRQVPTSTTDPLVAAIGPLDVMRFPLQAGDRWTQIDKTIATGMDFDADGRQESASVRSEVQVIGLESVSTPAATFPGALHQRTTLTVVVQLTSVPQAITVVTTVDDWYAPDIGPVRTTLVTTSQGVSETQTMALVGYRVGTLRSDTVAPTLQATTPASGGTLRPDGHLVLTFSEPMDMATLPTAVTLTGPAGQALPLGISGQGAAYTFTTSGSLGTGRYTVRVGTGATDLYGNALAQASSWTFDVDATGPHLLQATPADGATEVALDTAIVLRFSEPLDPASLAPGNVWLSTAGNDVPFTPTLAGDTLTLRPTNPLQRGQRYDLRIFGSLRDLAGNTMGSDLVLSFMASAGRFAAPVTLATAGLVDAVAVGDVNGDGRADVVFTTGYSFGAGQDFKLMVRLQQPDGSLAAAQVMDTLAQYGCPARSVVIGDLNGDGRNDVLVGADGCGIQVFRQGSDGVLRATTFIDSTVSGRLRLADFNRDGRMDLASSGYYGSTLRVWLQASDGTLQLHATPAVEYSSGADLDVGDVNGDGRPDLVSTSVCGIAIVLQNADGSFAPAVCRAAVPADSVRGVAVGDINGDGRDDIVFTYGGNSAGKLGVIRQQADGSLGTLATMDNYDIPTQVEIADLNGDGRRDVVVAHNGWMAITVHLQQADGSLTPAIRYPGPYGNFNPGAMAVGDVTGDGRVDVVITEALLVQRPVDTMAQAVPAPRRSLAAALRRLEALAR